MYIYYICIYIYTYMNKTYQPIAIFLLDTAKSACPGRPWHGHHERSPRQQLYEGWRGGRGVARNSGGIGGVGGVFTTTMKCIMIHDVYCWYKLVFVYCHDCCCCYFFAWNILEDFPSIIFSQQMVRVWSNQSALHGDNLQLCCVQVVVKNGPVTSGASLRTPWKVLAAHTARKGMERGQNFEKPEIFCPFFSSNPQWHGPRWSSWCWQQIQDSAKETSSTVVAECVKTTPDRVSRRNCLSYSEDSVICRCFSAYCNQTQPLPLGAFWVVYNGPRLWVQRSHGRQSQHRSFWWWLAQDWGRGSDWVSAKKEVSINRINRT